MEREELEIDSEPDSQAHSDGSTSDTASMSSDSSNSKGKQAVTLDELNAQIKKAQRRNSSKGKNTRKKSVHKDVQSKQGKTSNRGKNRKERQRAVGNKIASPSKTQKRWAQVRTYVRFIGIINAFKDNLKKVKDDNLKQFALELETLKDLRDEFMKCNNIQELIKNYSVFRGFFKESNYRGSFLKDVKKLHKESIISQKEGNLIMSSLTGNILPGHIDPTTFKFIEIAMRERQIITVPIFSSTSSNTIQFDDTFSRIFLNPEKSGFKEGVIFLGLSIGTRNIGTRIPDINTVMRLFSVNPSHHTSIFVYEYDGRTYFSSIGLLTGKKNEKGIIQTSICSPDIMAFDPLKPDKNIDLFSYTEPEQFDFLSRFIIAANDNQISNVRIISKKIYGSMGFKSFGEDPVDVTLEGVDANIIAIDLKQDYEYFPIKYVTRRDMRGTISSRSNCVYFAGKFIPVKEAMTSFYGIPFTTRTSRANIGNNLLMYLFCNSLFLPLLLNMKQTIQSNFPGRPEANQLIEQIDKELNVYQMFRETLKSIRKSQDAQICHFLETTASIGGKHTRKKRN